MSHNQTLFLVHMYNDTLKRRNLERDGVPRVIGRVLQLAWADILGYALAIGVQGPLRGLIG